MIYIIIHLFRNYEQKFVMNRFFNRFNFLSLVDKYKDYKTTNSQVQCRDRFNMLKMTPRLIILLSVFIILTTILYLAYSSYIDFLIMF